MFQQTHSQTMVEFLTNPIFKFAILPIGSAILGVGVKYVSRNDQYAKFRKEDMAVGLDLALTACLMFVVLTTDRAIQLVSASKDLSVLLGQNPPDMIKITELQARTQQISGQIASSGWFIFLMFLGLISLSTLVRKFGWESETKMRTPIGIALPLIFGILAILVVMASAV